LAEPGGLDLDRDGKIDYHRKTNDRRAYNGIWIRKFLGRKRRE
jgi:hypothetical protein